MSPQMNRMDTDGNDGKVSMAKSLAPDSYSHCLLIPDLRLESWLWLADTAMVDRVARDKFAELLHHFAAGNLTKVLLR